MAPTPGSSGGMNQEIEIKHLEAPDLLVVSRVMDKHNFSVRGHSMDSVQRMHRYSVNKPNISWVKRITLNQ